MIALLAALPAIGVVALIASRRARPAPPPPSAPVAQPPAWSPPRAWRPAEPRAAATVATQPSPNRFIQAIRVDRTDVCPNEPVFVEVYASDPRERSAPLWIAIGDEGGRRAAVRFRMPGEQRLLVRAKAADGAQDFRVVRFQVHDCGGAFQYVAIATQAAAQPDAFRFLATPFFDRDECASATAGDGGPPSPADLRRCNAEIEPGEKRSFQWDFGDGATATTDEPYAEHSYADRPQDDVQSNFIVKVVVESSVHGTITGLSNVLLANASTANKLRVGVVTPTVTLGALADSDPRTLAWSAVAHNPERVPVTLEDVDVTLTSCGGGADSKTFTVRASEVLDDIVLAPGTTETRAHLATADVAPRHCFVSFSATGKTADGYVAKALFGTRLRSDATVTIGPDEQDPVLKARYEKSVRALQILGRGLDGGPATVTDDEIRALELQGKLD